MFTYEQTNKLKLTLAVQRIPGVAAPACAASFSRRRHGRHFDVFVGVRNLWLVSLSMGPA